MNTTDLVNDLVNFYGESSIVPSRSEWQRLAEAGPEGSICMVNFMKFRDVAAYDTQETVSGIEALMRYQEVANKKVTAVGGEFLATGLFGGILIGEAEDWDAIGIVRYPNKEAFIEVFCDPEYRDIHRHRIAGTLRHRMAILCE